MTPHPPLAAPDGRARALSRADTSPLARWWWTVDRVLLGAFAVLALLGLALVATASPAVAERIGLPPHHFFVRHAVLLGPALLGALALSALPPRWLWRGCALGLAAGLAGLVVALASGQEVKGAARWITVFGQSVQPAEFVKPTFAVVTAWALARAAAGVAPRAMRWAVAVLYAAIAGLLVAQPDLGTAVQVSAVLVAQCVLAGAPLRLAGLAAGAGAGALAGAYAALPHVRSRIDRFLDPDAGDTYQVDKSLESFAAGGFAGVGPGHGGVKAALPDAHADFALAVAGEEGGAVAVWVVLGLFALIAWQGGRRLSAAPDVFAVLAGGGLIALLSVQAAIHAGSALALLPAKGMTLPFLSYGGSALLSAAASAGMILALTRAQGGPEGISRGSLTSTGPPA
jgi:cell division protein FtsW